MRKEYTSMIGGDVICFNLYGNQYGDLKIGIGLSYNFAVTLLVIYPSNKNVLIWKDICISISIIALTTIAKI